MIVRATRDFAWLTERTGLRPATDCQAIEAVDADGRTRGMVAFEGWTANAVIAHVALDSVGAGRALLRPAFAYPFTEAGRGMLLGLVPGDNRKSLNLARRLGFRETHRIVDGWKTGADLVLFEMRRAECAWLKQARKAA